MQSSLLRIVLSGLLACSLVACKKKQESSESATSATASGSAAAAPSGSAATEPAGSAAAAPPAMKVSGEPVDACALLTKEQAGAALGGTVEGEPEKMAAQGSMLGMCTWMAGTTMGSVSARPANEFEGTTRDGKAVPGIGEQAMMTKSGLMVKLAGKPHFLQVMAMSTNGLDEAKTIELAKAAAAGAK